MFNLYAHLLFFRNKISRRLAALYLTAALPLFLNAQMPCVCTNCPQYMPDGFTGQFLIQIQNAANPTLGQNGQGVCGVVLHFDHEYLGDLKITLTSPAGQTVTLVGPIGFFGETDFTEWNVTFVPCGDAANPDPGFSATWNNNQPWGTFGNYSGSYYPNSGCLENFNTGPVNGQWTLTVIDGQAIDVGNFYNYEIIFCDPTGIDCFSCAANAGNLLQADVSACEGASSLDLDLPPTYTPPAVAPPASDYGYTYVIGGAGGIIQAFDPDANLSAYPPGTYTVCGMSYLLANEALIPPPNGALTVQQLTTQLNSSTPPFCGKVTSNCVNVTIKPIPPDEEESQTICAPQCYVFHNQTYCQTGTYSKTLMQNGCPYTATLHLTVNQPSFVNITEQICPDGCSQTPGFETACGQGNYTEKFVNSLGCDSTVTVHLVEIAVTANIVSPPPQLSCNQSSVQLSGAGSTTGSGVTYQWTASNGGNISGPATGITANVNAPGNYQLKVCRTIGGVTCCDTASTSVTSGQTFPLAPASVNGADQICPGQTTSYTVAPVPNATSYAWTVPAGATINSGQGTASIQVTWNGSGGGNVCVASVNSCGASAPACLPVQFNALPAQADITGDSSLCSGMTGTYAIAQLAGATSYTWTVPAGDTIISGQNTTSLSVGWTGAPGGTVCVTAANVCGAGPQDCFPVTVHEQPAADAGQGGSVCDSAFFLQAIPDVSGSTGAWVKVSGPGTAVFANANAASTAVSVSQFGNYGFVWTENNSGCSGSDTASVVFNETPSAGPVTPLCDAANQSYTISFPFAGGTAPFTAPGGIVANGIFTSDPIANGQVYSFSITDANGCVSPAISGSFNCNCATNAGQMSLQPLKACEGETVAAQHLGGENLDGDDVVSYILHDNPGNSPGAVLAQNTTGVFGFQNGMTYGQTYYISFVVGNNLNGFPDPADPCLSVSPGQPVTFFPIPAANAGIDSDTCGLALALGATTPAGTGQWTVAASPGGGTLAISDPQNPATAVTASKTGVYTLTWTVTENGCTNTDQVNVQFNDLPVLADLQRNCDAANENYTVSLTFSGGTPPYSVNGAPFAGNTFTSAPMANGVSYSFSVADANGCSAAPVTGSFSCNCATSAGTMQADTLSACEGATVTVDAYATAPVLDANDVTAYVLHSSPGPATGQVFDQNKTGVFGFQNGMTYGQTYYISLVAGNSLNGFPDPSDPCYSVAAGQPVVFLKNPVPDAGSDDQVCGQTISLQAAGSGFSGAWSQVSGPGTAVFSPGNSPSGQATVPVYGAYVFEWTETNGGCTGSDVVNMTFNESPSVGQLDETCNGTNTEFTVTFAVTGGAPPYTTTGLGGSYNGANFTSNPLPGNSAYSFSVSDANGCASPLVSGAKNCNCVTDAGSMPTLPQAFCEGDPATAAWNNDAALDADDVLRFILHDQAGTSVGTVFAQNSQPSFDLLPPLTTGVTYYISAIAGNNLNGNVDLNDPCLSVTPGVPVMWKPAPDASLSGDAAICEGGSAVLTFGGQGVFPLTVVYSDGSGNQNSLTINDQQPVNITVTPTVTSAYTLLSVSDGTSPVCSAALNQSVTVTVNPPVSAGLPNEPVELCEGTALPLQLINFLTGADPGGQWTETSAVPSLPGGFNAATGTFFTAGQPAGAYTFSYKVTGQAPCPDGEAAVTVKLLAPPVADAGEDKAINCDQISVLLGGPNTSSGPGTTYDWQANGVSVGNTAQLFTAAPGTYTLTVSTAAGCSATDAATVILDNEPPSVEKISVKNIRCFGEKNGSISVDSFQTTHPPVLFSLNGGPFSTQPVFPNLESGSYVLTLTDANGCEWSSQPILVSEPPQLFIDLGPEVEAALGDSVYLKVLTSVPADALDTIAWKPLLDTAAAGRDYQRFFPLQSWKVHVTVVDSSGCVAVDEVLVKVSRTRHVFIPNIINPNSAENAVATVFGGRDVAEVEAFRVFDRWGEMVFETLHFQPNDPSAGWDGTYENKPVSPGVYVYYARVKFIDGETEIFKGDVTVFR